jgi:hypothetical protein
MTITVSSFGNNSKCLAIDNATTNQVLDSIATQVTAAGYELWDTVTTGTPCRVFRNLCSDGVTYKYIVFAFSNTTTSGTIQLYLYSAWNNSTHTGTNPAWGTVNYLYVDTGISNVIVSSNLYLVIASRFIAVGVSSSSSGQSGYAFVAEFANDNPLDTPVTGKVPAFLSSNPVITNNPVGGVTMDMNGVTGQTAFTNGAGIVASNGVFGPTSSMGFYMNVQSAKNPIASDGVFYNSIATAAAQLRGRIYGLKILPNYFGTFGSVVSLKVDSNGFLDPNGTPTDHLIFSNYAFPM